MNTVSFQIDDETKAVLDELAKSEGISRSDVLRRMLKWQQFQMETRKLQHALRHKVKEHKLETEDDFEAFLG